MSKPTRLLSFAPFSKSGASYIGVHPRTRGWSKSSSVLPWFDQYFELERPINPSDFLQRFSAKPHLYFLNFKSWGMYIWDNLLHRKNMRHWLHYNYIKNQETTFHKYLSISQSTTSRTIYVWLGLKSNIKIFQCSNVLRFAVQLLKLPNDHENITYLYLWGR